MDAWIEEDSSETVREGGDGDRGVAREGSEGGAAGGELVRVGGERREMREILRGGLRATF